MNIFEKATRLKLRFQSNSGMLNVEDLWDLDLSNERRTVDLNRLAKSLNKKIKENDEFDFVSEKSSEDQILKLKFDIVLHIIDVKKDERAKTIDRTKRKLKEEKIMEIINQKKDEDLNNKSISELEKELLKLKEV
jgi:phosphoribosylanthranilate isomerase